MCGRFSLGVSGDDLARVYRALADPIAGWGPHYSVAPFTMVPILRSGAPDDPARVPDVARWGFHPSWARENGPRPINARLETVATKPMFRAAMSAMRCIVPMTGYFEWTTEAGRKVPHHIHSDEILSAAAIATPGDGEAPTSIAIVTSPARDAAGRVHDRMPVFVTAEDLDEWIDPHRLDRTGAEALAHHVGAAGAVVASGLRADRVDPRVNSVGVIDPTDPRLVEPIG